MTTPPNTIVLRHSAIAALGVCLLLPKPLPAQAADANALPRQMTAKVLYVTDSKDPKKQSGVMDVILRLSENATNQPVVSCSIPTPGIRNDQWQAAAWMAAFVATRRLDLQVSDYEFTVNATGVIDGPSAGMELAASLIALINNVPVKSGRIMTGSVNPDGTIGPVGGIAAKIEAASRLQAAAAKSSPDTTIYVGIPVGQRLEFREEEGKFVDLIDLARQRKVTAVELKDVDDAYTFLTDQRLPNASRSAPVTTPQISLAAINRLRGAHLAMQEEVAAASKTLAAICERRVPDGTPRDYDGQFLLSQLSLAGDYSRRSTAASNGGALIAGYYHLLKAATCADIGKNYDRILGPQAASGKSKASDRSNPLLAAVGHIIELRREVAKAREELALAIKDTIQSRQLAMKLEALNAQLSLREAYSYETAADDIVLDTLVQILKAEAEAGDAGKVAAPEFYPMVQQACTYYALAKTRYSAARNWYSFSVAREKTDDLEVRPGMPFFQSIGSAFSKGAQSALAYLDATMKQGWEAYIAGNQPPIRFEGSQVPFKIRGAKNQDLPIRIALAGSIPLNDESFPRIATLIEGRYLPARKAAFHEAVHEGADAAGLTESAAPGTVPDSALARLLKEKWVFTTPPIGDLDAFGSGASAFLSLSSLVVKYYNYQGDDQRMMNSRSIGIYIDLARSKALARAGLLRERITAKLGTDNPTPSGAAIPGAESDYLLPEAITVNLELADILRYGGPDDKVISLMTFWRANMLADLALSMITFSEKNAQ
jgi:hypothetical protein